MYSLPRRSQKKFSGGFQKLYNIFVDSSVCLFAKSKKEVELFEYIELLSSVSYISLPLGNFCWSIFFNWMLSYKDLMVCMVPLSLIIGNNCIQNQLLNATPWLLRMRKVILSHLNLKIKMLCYLIKYKTAKVDYLSHYSWNVDWSRLEHPLDQTPLRLDHAVLSSETNHNSLAN